MRKGKKIQREMVNCDDAQVAIRLLLLLGKAMFVQSVAIPEIGQADTPEVYDTEDGIKVRMAHDSETCVP